MATPDVMSQIQKEHNPQRMEIQDILKHDAEKNHPGLDWKKAYASLIDGTNKNKIRVIRNGNTLFALNLMAPHEANVLMFTASRDNELQKDIQESIKAVQKAGFKKIHATLTTPGLMKLIQSAGVDVKTMPSKSFGSGNPSVEVEITL
jgi:hypothetical protein